MAISLTAPAKVNINLKIAGKRDDGYHHLISLAGFTEFGDILHFEPATEDRLTLSGTIAAELTTSDNLITFARDGLRSKGYDIPPTHIWLEKNLPVGGGIGGGSSDAAATLRGLIELYGLHIKSSDLHSLALSLGADVPVCLAPGWQIMSGIGDVISPLHNQTENPFIVLANPGQHVSTPSIFSALNAEAKPGQILEAITQDTLLEMHDYWQHADWSKLVSVGNDLDRPAKIICPQIDSLLSNIADLCTGTDIYGIGMSGSGASCFALCPSADTAEQIATNLTKRGYWAIASKMR